MNKILTTLLAGAFTLSLGSIAFAADATPAASPVKAEAAKAAEPAKADATKAAEPEKKHTKKAKKTAPAAAPAEAK